MPVANPLFFDVNSLASKIVLNNRALGKTLIFMFADEEYYGNTK
jgi:hypothetical protein